MSGLSASAPQPGTESTHLRPCTGLELADRAVTLLRMRPALLIGLGGAGGVLALMADMAVDPAAPETFVIGLAVGLAARWPLSAALIGAFQTMLVPRRPLEAGATLRAAFQRLPQLWFTLLIAEIVITTIGLVLPYKLLFPPGGASLSPATAGLAGAVAATALYLSALWALTPAVVLLENRMLFDALGRSAELMKLRFSSRLFGDSAIRRLILLFALPLIAQIGFLILAPAVQWIARGMPPLDLADLTLPSAPTDPVWRTAYIATAALLACIVSPYIQAALAGLYAECRMRREGIDLQTRLLDRESSGHSAGR